MKTVNKVILVGHVGGDPVLRQTKTGHSVTNFSLATNRFVAAGAEPETQWHRIVVWGRHGEVCNQYLKKGALAYIEGELRTHDYESKEGEKRKSVEVHANEVHFLGGKRAASAPEVSAPVL